MGIVMGNRTQGGKPQAKKVENPAAKKSCGCRVRSDSHRRAIELFYTIVLAVSQA
jgi:hypothetical protein